MLKDAEGDFTMEELNAALKKLNMGKATGIDLIPNELLVRMGPNAKKAVLHLFNESWRRGRVPMSWALAEIIPLLKKGKEATSPESYRPVALTSCLAKLMEQLVAARLSYITERWNKLCPEQAGGDLEGALY